MSRNKCIIDACENEVFIKKRQLCRKCYYAKYNSTYQRSPEMKQRDRERSRQRYAAQRQERYQQLLRGELVPLGKYPEPITTSPCGYREAHDRARRYFGRPPEHECVACGEQAEEWAYKNASPTGHEMTGPIEVERRKKHQKGTRTRKATWSTNPLDYQPMCRPCHWEMDEQASRAVA